VRLTNGSEARYLLMASCEFPGSVSHAVGTYLVILDLENSHELPAVVPKPTYHALMWIDWPRDAAGLPKADSQNLRAYL
jgi:hypothetical protein